MSLPLHFILVFVGQWFHFILGTGEAKMNYHSPVAIPLVLAANFGELRPNHFHMGIDIKTNGKEGYPLLSIDEGYVSRVSISPYGYGRVVYINHPGGITSVYAHCQQMTGKLAKKVREFQLRSQSSEVEIYFDPNEIKLKKGEAFALSGNSGSSTGPHLHFEIRDTYTEEALNPLLFGFDVKDTRKPEIYAVKLYSVDKNGFLTGNTREYRIFSKGNQNSLGTIQLPANFTSPSGGVGFAISGVDFYDEGYHVCGLYGTHFIANGDTISTQRMDRIAFENTRYINIHTDLNAYTGGKKFHKSFFNTANPLGIHTAKNNGILSIKPGGNYQLEYDVFDVSDNHTKVAFGLSVSEGEMAAEPEWGARNYLYPDSSWSYQLQNAWIEVPKKCTYEPISKSIEESFNSVTFRSEYWPVQTAYTVRLKPLSNVPIVKQYLASTRGKGTKALETIYINGWLEAKSKYFGETTVRIDQTAPTLSALNMRSIIDSKRIPQLYWRISDGETGLMDYGIWIDDKWDVLDYESKGNFAYFDTRLLSPGSHKIRITAIDYAQNTKEVEYIVTVQ